MVSVNAGAQALPQLFIQELRRHGISVWYFEERTRQDPEYMDKWKEACRKSRWLIFFCHDIAKDHQHQEIHEFVAAATQEPTQRAIHFVTFSDEAVPVRTDFEKSARRLETMPISRADFRPHEHRDLFNERLPAFDRRSSISASVGETARLLREKREYKDGAYLNVVTCAMTRSEHEEVCGAFATGKKAAVFSPIVRGLRKCDKFRDALTVRFANAYDDQRSGWRFADRVHPFPQDPEQALPTTPFIDTVIGELNKVRAMLEKHEREHHLVWAPRGALMYPPVDRTDDVFTQSWRLDIDASSDYQSRYLFLIDMVSMCHKRVFDTVVYLTGNHGEKFNYDRTMFLWCTPANLSENKGCDIHKRLVEACKKEKLLNMYRRQYSDEPTLRAEPELWSIDQLNRWVRTSLIPHLHVTLPGPARSALAHAGTGPPSVA